MDADGEEEVWLEAELRGGCVEEPQLTEGEEIEGS
jgi:hypothetical protein